MPWKIVEGGTDCPFELVKEGSGERVACHPTRAEAEAHMKAMYANEPMMNRGRVEVDERTAAVAGVNFPERIITVVACPYESPTEVPYHGEMYTEIVSRSAFAGIQRKNKIRVNREHDRVLTVGKVTGYYPDRDEGLVIDTYIANTPLGEETLELAAAGILDGSVGMKVAASDQVVNPRNRTRRINRAFLDHFAFTADPAYRDAQVLSVRTHIETPPPQPPSTPGLDGFWSDPIFRWADDRLSGS